VVETPQRLDGRIRHSAGRIGRPAHYHRGAAAEGAKIYRQHFDKGPTEAVRRSFGVSYRTAARYVQQARTAGYLPATDPGKKRT
jgi:hypothetical protein